MLKLSLIGNGLQTNKFKNLIRNKKKIQIDQIITRKNINKENLKKIATADIIYIGTPPEKNFYYLNYLKKIKFRNYIIIEKPVSTSLKEIKLLEKFNKNLKKKIFPIYNFQFSKLASFLNKQFKDKRNGKIKRIDVQITHPSALNKDWKHQWRIKNDLGPIFGIGIHFIDYFHTILGKFKRSYFHSSSNIYRNKIDTIDFSLLFNKTYCSFHFSYYEPAFIKFNFLFENAIIKYDGEKIKYFFNKMNKRKKKFVHPKITRVLKSNFYKDWDCSYKLNVDFIFKEILKKNTNNLNKFNNHLNPIKNFFI